MQSIKRIAALLFCFILTLSLGAFAYAADTKTVRVAVMNYPDFLEREEDGSITGYAAEYLSDIAEYTDWRYEYIDMPFGEALQKLQTGEVDIVAATQKAPGREALFDFSESSMGVNSALLCVLAEDPSYAYEDYENFQGMRIGGIVGSAFVELCRDHMAQQGVRVTISEYATDDQARQALDSGRVDALVMGTIRCTSDYTVIARMGSVEMHFATNPRNPAIKAGIDAAQQEIHNKQRYYEMKLDEKYFGDIQNSLQLTKAEQELIGQLGTMPLGYVSIQDPVSYTDPKTGEFSGMTRDILDRISELSGISFDYVPLPAGMISFAYLTEHNIGLIASVEYNPMNFNSKEMFLTDPYLSAQKVFVGRNGTSFDKNASMTVAMATGSGSLQEFLHTKYPDFTILPYDSVEESFQAVLNGDADIVMQNQYVVTYLLSKPQYEALSAFPVEGLSDQLCLASLAIKDENGNVNAQLTDPRLISILNKTISQISDDELSKIVAKYTTGKPYHLTTQDMLYKYRTPFACILILLVLCMAMFLVILSSRQKNLLRIEAKNAQLSEAIAHADQASKAKSTFLARMSHEIRTPMNAIMGLTTIAKTNIDDKAKVEDSLSKIESSSKILLNIINDVLDMSAIESDKLKIAHQPFDLKELLTSITALYYTQCKQKDIAFELNCAEVTEERLIGDPLRVNQILLNFLSNAYKFTNPGGSVSVRVSETAKRDTTVFFRITVSDTGIGMSEDMQKRLFHRFEQENASTAQLHGGSGLGMSITKNLVELMQGSVKVESELGKGSAFTVDIPFEINPSAPGIDSQKLKRIRALIVDDSEDACEYTSIVLDRIGVNYDIASSGAKALSMLEETYAQGSGYDICFLDWKMPGITGIELTQQIRERFDADTVIIIVSAYDVSEIEEEAKTAGVNLFIAKPLFQSTVFNLLMSLSGGQYAKAPVEQENYDFSGKRVLLAEDNALNSEIATELLDMVNMAVDRAENGQIAVELFETSAPGTYDGILMDIQMPVMDGYEAARQIRKSRHPQAKTIPIWAMTANAFNEDVAEALSSGMDGHIAKPIDTAVLYQSLQESFSKGKSKENNGTAVHPR